MSFEVRVSTGDVAAKAALLAREAQDIEARLGGLTAQVADLAASWTGPAAASFQALYADWDRTARRTQTALAGIGSALRGAGYEYDALEQQLARRFA